MQIPMGNKVAYSEERNVKVTHKMRLRKNTTTQANTTAINSHFLLVSSSLPFILPGLKRNYDFLLL